MDYTHSPPFRLLHTAVIGAGGQVLVRPADASSDADSKYAPFNQLFIQNFDGQPLEIEYGLGRRIRIPGGLSMGINQPGIDQIRIINVGVAATSEPIEVIWQLRPSTEDIMLAMYMRIPLTDAMRR